MFSENKNVVNISGLCTNCDNVKICDFIKDAKIFMRDKKCAEKIIDSEITVYSCDKYESAESIVPKDGMCSYCGKRIKTVS